MGNRVIAPGTILAERYEVLGPLGRGGMAQVYRARHLGLDREVALKVIPARESEAASERFAREARNAARLDHPGCVRVIDFGTALGLRYLAMDLLPGRSLRQELDAREQLEPVVAVHLVAQLLEALEHAHGCGVLHRDVKPENVMCLTGAWPPRVVLIDFGLSRIELDAPLTEQGACVGSPSYLAPERLQRHAYDARADLYSVGILLYELLAGRRPFRGKSSLEIARQHLTEVPEPLAALCPDLPPALTAVVDRALAKDPGVRFADARRMREALVRVTGAASAAPASARAPGGDTAPPREESTYIVAAAEPPALQRLWARLRFGRWRWRRRALALPAASSSAP